MKEIWLDKYRPTSLADVFGNDDTVKTLRACVKQGTIPNLILTGPPGVGKTSSLLCIAKQLLGDKLNEAYKELNASDERGIETVREQIKIFAQKKAILPPGRTKIILLDQADSLTEGAQHALRMIMSNYSDTTRFVLSCNNSQKIIQPIQSRCIILRFSKLKDEDIQKNLQKVIEGQKVRVTENAFKTMLFISDGDMRQAINNLQACYFASQGQNITEDLVLHICDAPSIQAIKQTLKLAISNRLNESLTKMHEIYQQGHSIYDIVNTIHKVLMTMYQQIGKEKTLEMLRRVSLMKKRTLQGLTSQLQIGQFLAQCTMIK